MAQLNVIDFSTCSNAMIQDISEGPMRKNAVHIQRKNCGSKNTEEKQLLDYMGQWRFVWGYRLYFFLFFGPLPSVLESVLCIGSRAEEWWGLGNGG